MSVVLPYSLYRFRRLFTSPLIDDNSFATVLFVPLFLASQFGKLLTRRLVIVLFRENRDIYHRREETNLQG
jgi:hypothetical protein